MAERHEDEEEEEQEEELHTTILTLLMELTVFRMWEYRQELL